MSVVRWILAAGRRGRVPRATVRVVTGAGLGVGLLCVLTFAAAPALAGLPDGRAYELVSGSEVGEAYYPRSGFYPRPRADENTWTEYPMRAAVGGDAVTYAASAGASGGNGITGAGLGNQFLATRDPQAGWRSTDITPQAFTATDEIVPAVYEWLSGELNVGIFSTFGETPQLAAEASPGPAECGSELYSRTGSGFHALFSKSEVSSFCGHDRGEEPSGPYIVHGLIFAGTNEGSGGGALSGEDDDLLFQTSAALNAGEEEAPEEGEGGNLYDSVGGVPHAVNVLPSGEFDPDATFGGTSGEPYYGEAANQIPGDFSDIVSPSGSRVFWTAIGPLEELEVGGEARRIAQPQALYAREEPTAASAHTVQIDTSEAPAGNGATEVKEREERSGGGRFWAANREGTRVFFTDCARLVEESTAVPGERCTRPAAQTIGPLVYTGNDLYEYNFDRPIGERLKDLTVDHSGGDPLGANVQGVLGASEDGSYVYFVASGALAPGAENRKCREPEQEVKDGHGILTGAEVALLNEEQELEEKGHLPSGRGCNLYVWHEGSTSFIAALAAKDDRILRYALSGNSQRVGDWLPNMGLRSAEVSPDGRNLVFESGQQLTGYDNTDLDEQRPREENPTGNLGLEIFVYSAEDGSLICASCNPTGAPPVRETEAGGPVSYGGTYLPPSLNPTFMPRWMSSDGGRVFFDSSQPLVGQDTNGVQDVYEWEREGEGSCAGGSASVVTGGCTYLLSGGDGSDDSDFLDADAEGDNVFFTHRGQLEGVGIGGARNQVFDVRVDGGFSSPSLACTGTGCQGLPPAPPVFATPPTATALGPGDLVPPPPPAPVAKKVAKCAKGSTRDGRGRCVRSKCTRGKVRKRGRCVGRRRAEQSSKMARDGRRGR